MKPSSSPKAVPARKNPSSMTKPSDTTLKPHMKTEPADPIITGRQAEGHATTTPPSAVGISPDGTHHAEEDLKAVQPRTAVDVDRKAATESNVDKPVVTRPGRVDSLGNHGPNTSAAAEQGTAGASNATTILQQRPFLIRAVKLDESGEGGQVTGSILSQSLDKLALKGRADAGTITLAGLRKIVPGMSRYPTLEQFCTPSGTIIDDETISFNEYLVLDTEDAQASAQTSGTPSVKLYYRSTKRGELVGKGANGEDASAIEPVDLSKEVSVKTREFVKPQLLERSTPGESQIMIEANTTESKAKSAGLLHEDDWDVVLRNCGVFYGWIIDPKTKRIVRAPKPAFHLRSKVGQTSVAQIPDWQPKGSVSGRNSEDEDFESLFDDDGRLRSAALAAKPIGATDLAPEHELATQLAQSPVKVEDNVDGANPAKSQVDSTGKGGEDEQAVVPKSEKGIPNFRVNDDSKIEITAHEDELTVSMAKSDFSESSTEVSVGVGGYGVGVSTSVGQALSKENTSATTSSSTTRTMVARYLFPRCDLLLQPDELVPTEELNELIQAVRRTKNIKILRKLQAEFGQLFCQRVTLGGRLLATRLYKSTETKTLEDSKEAFKTSVGASVGGFYGAISASVSAKNDQESGSSTINEKTQRAQDESAVFEAVGGDTILANNPPAWCASVADHANWRIINREGLSPLVEILSTIPGYEAVQSWFVQAVPALSNYMVLDQGHECKARFRVNAPTNSLSKSNVGNNVSFYLGHDAKNPVTPCLNGVYGGSAEVFWLRVRRDQDIPIFNPPTYQAPAILGYENFEVGDTAYGAAFNQAFVQSEWTVIAPFDEELLHGTRVILRTTPLQDTGTPDPAPNASHMVIFRNAQGQFLPAMSDAGEYQYWRILKTGTSSRYIKPGDEVRLAWDFRDQTTGWRDFLDDVFGRRQPNCPPGYDSKSPLFLKVPWPRFETSGKPTALIMNSQQGDLAAAPITINNKGRTETFQYCLQDLKLRIDGVGNGGRGDAEDYLLNQVKMEGVTTHWGVSIRPPGLPSQMRSSIFWFGIT